MISADQLLQCDVRLRQAKMQEHQRFGGLCTVLCGDFLQLPPVDKHGTRKSLARPVDPTGGVEPDDDVPEAAAINPEDIKDAQRKEQAALEGRQGFELWRGVRRVGAS